jgi:L-lysine exporter family protein LysE/ArgO
MNFTSVSISLSVDVMPPAAVATTILAGLAAGASLIIAIGAQNAFVLRQGLRREHVLPIVLICIASDAILIALGIAGIGGLVRAAPAALEVVRWAGFVFLVFYGILAARRAFRPEHLDTDSSAARTSLVSAVLTCVALTWLNPHVYLDTVVLLGSLATPHGDPGRWFFGLGAVIASTIWFTALGFGARFLAPVFARPIAWRILDAGVAVLMWTLAILLVVQA